MGRDPASRSWSPPGVGSLARPVQMSAAVRKDLALNLSAVHENIRGRASNEFRNWFRVEAFGIYRSDVSFFGGVRLRRTPSSSAMSPVGYSSAVLSSSRLRFADLFNGGADFG
jgi:hypothetical protein